MVNQKSVEIGHQSTKICKKCGEEKELSCFRINRKSTGSRRTECIDCGKKISREHTFKITRGISHEERDKLLELQGGVCKCCGKSTHGSKKGWHVDHNHATGVIRGVLCANCNIALGQVNDSIEQLEQLIMYIKENK